MVVSLWIIWAGSSVSTPLITTELVEYGNGKIPLFFVVILEENSLCLIINGLMDGNSVLLDILM